MTIPTSGGETSRRNFLRLAGLGAAAVAGGSALSACGSKPKSGGTVQDINKASGVLPNFKDLSLPIPPPDVKGTPPIADGYTSFPKELLDAISEKPGTSGKEIRAMTPVWGPAPAGIDRNAYLQAVNAELGTPINFTAGDGNTYADKLNAMFGARDVPDLLCVPSWEYPKIPRFSQATAALFEDLTDYLKGDAVAKYPMMACFPTVAWKHSVWNDRLMAIPNDTSFGFGWVMLSRKDLLDKDGHALPANFEELLTLAKEVTNPKKKVWAFNDIFPLVQMYFRSPQSQGGWRLKADGTPEFKYETAEYKQALEAMVKIVKDGLVHPDILATKGADGAQLFAPGGQILFTMNGMGAWQGAQAEHQKVVKDLKIAPVPFLSAVAGKDPLAAGSESPISFTFIKKGLGKERVEELLRVINWCSAPFGTKEFLLRDKGIEGKHFNNTANGPVTGDLGFKEIANQYFFVSGRRPVQQPTPDTPDYVRESREFLNSQIKYVDVDPWVGMKLEMPAKYKASQVPFEDKFTDIVRGRRPVSDVDKLVQEWRADGGDEARQLLAKALADAKK